MIRVFPVAYFGSISYFETLAKGDSVVFEVNDHFPKQTFRNRMQIRDAQGLQMLTLPVEKVHGSKTCTKDIRVSGAQKWPLIHWRAIRTAYALSPYFEHYEQDIYRIIFSGSEFLVDYHELFLDFLIRHLNISLNWSYSESYFAPNDSFIDFRQLDFEKQEASHQYTQVIFPEQSFIPTVSALDALFCEGPLLRKLLL